MKRFLLIPLLLIFFIAGGSTQTSATEEKAYKDNAVTGFYGSYESSSSDSSDSSSSSQESTSSETSEPSASKQESFPENKIYPGTKTISAAYQEKLPVTGDITYHLQMMLGVIIIGLAMYLIIKKQKHIQ